jgi:sugar-phosphatase
MKPKTNPILCKAVLFDLDGVLIDSSSCIVRHWARWADKHNLDLDTIMEAAHGKRTIDTMQIIAPHLDLEAEEREFTRGEVDDVEGIRALPGARQLLESLPDGRWTIVTSAGDALAHARLTAAGLPIPPEIVTADRVDNGKPDPEGYLMGSRLLGILPEDCIVLEDAPAGIRAGKSAGIRVFAVASTHPPGELAEADVVIPTLNALKVTQENRSDGTLAIQFLPNRI